MSVKKSLTFLGTGGSVGVPLLGCNCHVCVSRSPFNQRLRTSALLEIGSRRFLIDVGPDFRQQALRENLTTFDGLLLTHAHYDHTAGLDDLRPIHFNRHAPLPILLSPETEKDITNRFHYLFYKEQAKESFSNKFELVYLPSTSGEIFFEGVLIRYISYEQGGMVVNGYRIGDFAYLTDIKHYSEDIFSHLEGVKTLVISALRMTPSYLHLCVDEAIDFVHRLKSPKAWLTHLSHELDYEQTNAYLPPYIRLAYDGLKIDFE